MFDNLKSFNQTSSSVSILKGSSVLIKDDEQFFSSKSLRNFIKFKIKGGNIDKVISESEKELNNNIYAKNKKEDENKQKNLALVPYKKSNNISYDNPVQTKFDILNQQKYKISMPVYRLPKESYPIDYYDMRNYPLALRNGYFFNQEDEDLNIFLRPNHVIVKCGEWLGGLYRVVHLSQLKNFKQFQNPKIKYISIPSFLGLNKFYTYNYKNFLIKSYEANRIHYKDYKFKSVVRTLFDISGRSWELYYCPRDNLNYEIGKILFPRYDMIKARSNMIKCKIKVPTYFHYLLTKRNRAIMHGFDDLNEEEEEHFYYLIETKRTDLYNQFVPYEYYLFREPTRQFYRQITDYFYFRYSYIPSSLFFEIAHRVSILVKEEWKRQNRNIFLKIWNYIKGLIKLLIHYIMSFFRRPPSPKCQKTQVMLNPWLMDLQFPDIRPRVKVLKHKGFALLTESRRHSSFGLWHSLGHNEYASTFIPIMYILDSKTVIDYDRMNGLRMQYITSSDDFIENDFILYTDKNQKNIRHYFRRYVNPKMDKKNFPLFGLSRRYVKTDEYGLPISDFYKEGKRGWPAYTYDENGNYIYTQIREMQVLYSRNFRRKLRQDHYNIFYGYPQINKYGTIIHNYPYPQTDNLGGLMYPCPYFDKDGRIVSEKKFYNWPLFYPYFYPEADNSEFINPQQYWTDQHNWIKKYLWN
jgi:hypothetical protein